MPRCCVQDAGAAFKALPALPILAWEKDAAFAKWQFWRGRVHGKGELLDEVPVTTRTLQGS